MHLRAARPLLSPRVRLFLFWLLRACAQADNEEDAESYVDEPPSGDDAPPFADEPGEKRLRNRKAVSYREPGITEGITRNRSPSPPPPPRPPRVGDPLEVEVDDTQAGIVWKHAEVKAILRNGRFRVVVDGDEDFTEEYGPEDEGSEWRRAAAYDGLKRQRRAVEHYKPESQRAHRTVEAFATRVGPFRHGGRDADGGGGGRRRSGSHRRASGGGSGHESSTMSSEGEFEERKKRSEARLRGAVQPLNTSSEPQLSAAAAAKLAHSIGGRAAAPAVIAAGREQVPTTP